MCYNTKLCNLCGYKYKQIIFDEIGQINSPNKVMLERKEVFFMVEERIEKMMKWCDSRNYEYYRTIKFNMIFSESIDYEDNIVEMLTSDPISSSIWKNLQRITSFKMPRIVICLPMGRREDFYYEMDKRQRAEFSVFDWVSDAYEIIKNEGSHYIVLLGQSSVNPEEWIVIPWLS